VLVDHWARWCGPCRQLSPVVEQVATERGNTLKVGTVNVDEQPSLAGVRGIPSVVLYRDGHPAAQSVGAQPKLALALGFDAAAAR
jgi:thioredoxin 1